MRKFKLSKKTRRIALQGQERKKPFISKKAVWGIIIAALMAFSIIGYLYAGPTQQNVDYNGYKFVPEGNPQTGAITGWKVKVGNLNNRETRFYNHPLDVLSINISANIVSSLRSMNVVTITSDPDDKAKDTIGLIAYEFQNLLTPSGVVLLVAFTANNTFNKPIMSCMNATAYEPILYFASGDDNRIGVDSANENCIHVEARSATDLLRMRDRLLYAYYAIIP